MPSDQPELPPETGQSGSDLTQRPATPDEVNALRRIPNTSGIIEYPLTEAIQQIYESGVRGQSAMILLQASVKSLESNQQDLLKERDNVRSELDNTRTELHKCQNCLSVLKERIRHMTRGSIVATTCSSLGALVLGVCVPILIESRSGAAIAGSALGAFLLIMGWVSVKLQFGEA